MFAFSQDISGATPITPLAKHAVAAWLERNQTHASWLAACGFKAEPGAHALLPEADGAARVLAVANEGPAAWAYAHLPYALPEGRYSFDGQVPAASEVCLGWAMGAYAFARYKAPRRAPAVLAPPADADIEEARRVAGGVFLARDLINTPAEDMGPEELAAAAVSLAQAHGATSTVIVGDELLAHDYPAIHAVGRASPRAPRLIDFTWGDADAPKLTLVGKGVCFDTGGLDIKPHDGMLEMKRDMGGAAVVLGLASAIMASGLHVRLRVLIPAVENSISGNAIRPLDIVRTRAGKSVEVGNTDAEGRLILCDALAEADRDRPDLLIDCATLTGAAKIALGPEVQALFCDDDEIAEGLVRAGGETGDPLWRMPIWRGYRKWIDGKCADLNNVAKDPRAGAIIAALYLSEFVSPSTRWAHLDIMAANVADRPGRPEGGEATAMRALYAFLRTRYS